MDNESSKLRIFIDGKEYPPPYEIISQSPDEFVVSDKIIWMLGNQNDLDN